MRKQEETIKECHRRWTREKGSKPEQVCSAVEYLNAVRGGVRVGSHYETGAYAGEVNEYGRPWSGVRLFWSPCPGTYQTRVRTLDEC